MGISKRLITKQIKTTNNANTNTKQTAKQLQSS
jgi:hypothetical protein